MSENKPSLSENRKYYITTVISIIALIASLIAIFRPLTLKPNVSFSTAKTIKFSQEYGTLTPNLFLFFDNTGEVRGKIFKITCTLLSTNKQFKREYFPKYYNDPIRKYEFTPFVVDANSTIATPLLFYPTFDEESQLENTKINSLRLKDFYNQKGKYNIPIPPNYASDSVYETITKLSLERIKDFKIGNYYLIISIYLTNKANEIPLQNVYTFALQEYVLEEIKNNIQKYKEFNDLQDIITNSGLSYGINSTILLNDVPIEEKREVLKIINR